MIAAMGDMSDNDRLRLDKWLWAARFYKTRTLAAEAIELGRVRVEGARIKPARDARVGETLDIDAAEVRRTVVIRALSAQRGPASQAALLYEETAESIGRRERAREVRRFGAEPALTLKGRPSKRDARLLRQFKAPADK
jgi:ribosome-associated heat shock protein Hsp15